MINDSLGRGIAVAIPPSLVLWGLIAWAVVSCWPSW
jgi:hypothetical protein